MPRTKTFYCYECDHEHECVLVQDENYLSDYYDVPDNCENCGESMLGGEPDYREDFHSDG